MTMHICFKCEALASYRHQVGGVLTRLRMEWYCKEHSCPECEYAGRVLV